MLKNLHFTSQMGNSALRSRIKPVASDQKRYVPNFKKTVFKKATITNMRRHNRSFTQKINPKDLIGLNNPSQQHAQQKIQASDVVAVGES